MIKGVLIDWGGVLTGSMGESIMHWIETDRIDHDHYREVMRDLVAEAYSRDTADNLIHALERGEIPPADFEERLAVQLRTLDGVPPVAAGLMSRMFAGFARDEAMYGMLREVRKHGVKTCLLSNSWGNSYPREGWDELFDAIVISGEVGMRKPEPRIFHHALDLIGLRPDECAFIDDIEANIAAAEALGINGILHKDAATTIAELERLLRSP
ncbi:HAD family hydrolase [Nonomuraea soli]|uniref:Putative hydrolase of the HAD superfamily n=1 Tax=Nonomuraea soli TaxID=1032476 RepID=A0A7W0CK97_9ACTN|nr:HAD family phosphatase [Nonomuraea soli]MBA2892713.1 putative hydrolase of the HAD superfamily [Nonomuraea soli]